MVTKLRNFDWVQFESVRRVVDPPINALHDELSDCYYNKKPFRKFGILTKEEFDKLHGILMTHIHTKWLHEENLRQGSPYPEEKYRYQLNTAGEVVQDNYSKAIDKIAAAKVEGIDLEALL